MCPQNGSCEYLFIFIDFFLVEGVVLFELVLHFVEAEVVGLGQFFLFVVREVSEVGLQQVEGLDVENWDTHFFHDSFRLIKLFGERIKLCVESIKVVDFHFLRDI